MHTLDIRLHAGHSHHVLSQTDHVDTFATSAPVVMVSTLIGTDVVEVPEEIEQVAM
jgi:hypothetical protein